jgi:hypothetical protein
MQEAGAEVIASFIDVGDGRGMDRVEFLVALAENGNGEQQSIVRNLWFQAATGKLTREAAAQAFDHLYRPYE